MAQAEGSSNGRNAGAANTTGKNQVPTRTQSMPQGLSDSHWYSPAAEAPTSAYHLYDHEGHQDPDHGKKSILVRVKEKAKRWRQMLGKKRNGRDGPDDTTPPWGVSLNETEADDPEYHGAPMYESEMATDTSKRPPVQMVSMCQYHGVGQISKVHHPDVTNVELEMKESNDVDADVKQKEEASSIRALPRTGSEIHLEGDVADKPWHTDRLSGTVAAGNKPPVASKIREHGARVRVRGASNREYLMQMLEPREEHRALSQVIAEAVRPRTVSVSRDRNEGGGDVVEKVKDAVRSLLGNEELHGSPIPLSTNPFSEIVDGEGRTIQAYMD